MIEEQLRFTLHNFYLQTLLSTLKISNLTNQLKSQYLSSQPQNPTSPGALKASVHLLIPHASSLPTSKLLPPKLPSLPQPSFRRISSQHHRHTSEYWRSYFALNSLPPPQRSLRPRPSMNRYPRQTEYHFNSKSLIRSSPSNHLHPPFLYSHLCISLRLE